MYAWIAQQTIIDRFTKLHKRGPITKQELEQWFESYVDTEEGKPLARQVTELLALGTTEAKAAEQFHFKEAKATATSFRRGKPSFVPGMRLSDVRKELSSAR